jgi:chromosome segregation ATPase
MTEIYAEEGEVLALLEERMEALSALLAGLRNRNRELEASLAAACEERDRALETLAQTRTEAEALRARQRQAAGRLKNLLTQVEQMELLREG